MTPDLRTASVEQCMDFVARACKYTSRECIDGVEWTDQHGHCVYDAKGYPDHPYASIDTADIPLPPGWSWLSLDFGEYGKCIALAMKDNDVASSLTCSTERLARWRAAALAWERWAGDQSKENK